MQRSPGLTSEAIGNIISNLIDKWVLEIETHIKITIYQSFRRKMFPASTKSEKLVTCARA